MGEFENVKYFPLGAFKNINTGSEATIRGPIQTTHSRKIIITIFF